MFRKTKYLLLFLGMFFSLIGLSQTKKTPSNSLSTSKIISVFGDDYKPNLPFLTMCENEDGSLIFGNIDGALLFNGAQWKKIKLPNNSSVTSLFKTQSGTIYAGGYNELGTIQKNKFGNYFYKSLISDFILEDKNLQSLWKINEYKNHIIFRTYSKLILITGNRVTQLPAKNKFVFSDSVKDNYFVQDNEFGIYKLDSKTMNLVLLFHAKAISNELIISILPTTNPNIITLISKNGNVFIGDLTDKTITKKLNIFEGAIKDNATYAILDNNNDYLIGTNSSKIITLTNSGKIIRDNPIFAGLSNSKIKSLFQTKNKNIWIIQIDKLSLLDFKSPYVCLFDKASVNDVLIKNKVIYLATNNGTYSSEFFNDIKSSTLNFKKIDNVQDVSYAIQKFDNDIIISNEKGLFTLKNGIAHKIGLANEFWKMIEVKNKKSLYLGSNFSGLYLIEKSGDNWSIKSKISGFDESNRYILADYEPDTYWVCHGYKGVYKIHFNEDYSRVDALDHYTNKNGFKSEFNINVFNWNKKIVFTSNNGIYTYNKDKNKFELYAPLNAIFGTSKNIRKLVQHNDKTWFIQDDEAGYFIGNNPKLHKDLFLNLKGSFNRGMESIYPIDDNTALLETNNGLWLYNLPQNQNKIILNTIISQVTYFKNQKEQFVELDSKKNKIKLPNEINNLRFEFSTPKMFSSSKILYSYKLENIDQNWSSWHKNAYCEYNNLKPGDYKFIVKSKNLASQIGKEAVYEFEILPKWYQTNLAYFFYIIVCGLLVYLIIKYVKLKTELNQIKLEIENKKSVQIWELKIEKDNLAKDKYEIEKNKKLLEENVLKKNKELANHTISLSMKKDYFDGLKNDLIQLRGLLKSEESRKKITEIFQKLNQHKINEEYIDLFDVHFEEINTVFFEKLLAFDPTLTKRELRLCTFIKMDVSIKELALLFNVSARTIENMRTKLRKKFNIQREDNFNSFLINLEKSEKK